MLLLRSAQRYNDVVSFDPSSGNVYDKSRAEQQIPENASVSGSFAIMDGGLWALFRLNGDLYLYTPNNRILLGGNMTAHIEKGAVNTLEIRQSGKKIFRESYPKPLIDPPLEEDITPFIEEEQHDFGVLIHNIVNSQERKQAIYQQQASV